MEEVSKEIVAHPQLGATRIWIAHGSEEPCFQAVVGFALLALEISLFEEPFLRLGRDLFAMSIYTKGERAVRDKIRYDIRFQA